jgi:xanthine/uracil permease
MRIIFTAPLTRRSIVIIYISLGIGIGAAFQLEFTVNLPSLLADFPHSPVAAVGSMAILANLILPKGQGVDKSGQMTDPQLKNTPVSGAGEVLTLAEEGQA